MRQKIAETVRLKSFGGVLQRGLTPSIRGSQIAHRVRENLNAIAS
jgi:hypothetical protein